ncbi:MAG: hypothetical protein U0575_09995 [Phycisphaerales bacterium]
MRRHVLAIDPLEHVLGGAHATKLRSADQLAKLLSQSRKRRRRVEVALDRRKPRDVIETRLVGLEHLRDAGAADALEQDVVPAAGQRLVLDDVSDADRRTKLRPARRVGLVAVVHLSVSGHQRRHRDLSSALRGELEAVAQHLLVAPFEDVQRLHRVRQEHEAGQREDRHRLAEVDGDRVGHERS